MATISDEQAAGQHYLVCGSQDCQKNGQFYCNDCHQPMCEQCKDKHRKRPDTKYHDIVLYRQRKHRLPVEKCKLHPTKNVDIFCRECKTPLCLKCFIIKGHKGHEIDELEEIYAEKYTLWQGEFSKIQKYFLPTSLNLKTDIKEDAIEIKKIMESIRTSMKAEAESLKNMVDEVTSEKIRYTHTMEKSYLQMLKSQEKTYDDYIAYLGNISDKFQEYLSIRNQKLLSSVILEIQSIPETTKPVPPVFTAGQYNRIDVAKILGRVSVPNTEPEKRKIQPTEVVSSSMEFTEKQLDQRKEKSNVKQTMSLSPFVTKVREYSVPGVDSALHVSVDKLDRFWVSDNIGNLVQTDLKGNQLEKIHTSGVDEGYHTVTLDVNLIYTDNSKKVIFEITHDREINEFKKTEDWTPCSIHSSRFNRDILVGMYKDREAKVTRYSKTGTEIKNMKRDNQGQELYDYPHYITENINGDICTSDHNKQAVVVVNKSGQYRFSYKNQDSKFIPYGICTDVLGHILVCDRYSETVRMLDQDGGFLSIILSEQQGIKYPRGVCVDAENNLYVGQYCTNTVKVYKYLQ
ncbi:uncharacterized protein LOC111114737 [Crassostrea virginica]